MLGLPRFADIAHGQFKRVLDGRRQAGLVS
jgi:hypothetical protein